MIFNGSADGQYSPSDYDGGLGESLCEWEGRSEEGEEKWRGWTVRCVCLCGLCASYPTCAKRRDRFHSH